LGEDFLWQFSKGKVVGGAEFAVPLGGGEGVPVEGGDPLGSGEVGGRHEAFELEEVGVAGGAGGVGEDGVGFGRGWHRPIHAMVLHEWGTRRLLAWLVEIDKGEHLAADGFVAGPEDEVVAPLHGFGDVREGEEIGAEAVGIHGRSIVRRWVTQKKSNGEMRGFFAALRMTRLCGFVWI
jgi:hypothetical protein